ncbi:sensor domain-containing diguanylate cyclase [Rubrivivax gelatinosus]|uniref:diguanylate cyclase n=1 Tax=Rubrivivax gelatinosus TaxID=28068 RepID=A0A4R2MFE9_RUBGE|nr:sensor domain-containing diguanylate cyclase [Rubrivivax gelatinosus]MBK1689986.1 GGDEF domain-containing protein [Rubrivivax gelatinosus]TCP03487.1 diguanylate cyclase (GGDEF)-like protein [Rubrivivax gelatinosus]
MAGRLPGGRVSGSPETSPRAWGSFRLRLTLGAGGLALCTLLGVGLYAARLATLERERFGGYQLLSAARSAAFGLASRLQEREKEIEILGRVPSLAENPLDSERVARSLALRKETNAEYAWMGVASLDGRVLNATGGLLLGADVRARPWFSAGLVGFHTGDVHEAALLAELMGERAPGGEPPRFIDLATPVIGPAGEVRGVLAAHVHWDWIAAALRRAVHEDPTAAQTEVLILGRDGSVLYPLRPPGTPLPGAPGLDRFGMQADPGGSTFLVARARVPATQHSDLGWSVVLRQPSAAATAPVLQLRDRLFMIGLAASLIVAALAYVLAARISRPLERLVTAVKAVREGRGGAAAFPRDGGSPEITALSDAVRVMTETLLDREARLEQANAHLEETVAERTRQLSRANDELARLAAQDALTGLANRRAFEQRAAEEQARSRRSGSGFGLLLLDIDHFKNVNDRFGHATGDRVLQQIARLLESSIRETDLAARLGGEEFAVLLPELGERADTMRVAEKIRETIQHHDFGGIGEVTVSAGCAWADGSAVPVSAALQQADLALYEAKGQGRNRCVAARGFQPG